MNATSFLLAGAAAASMSVASCGSGNCAAPRTVEEALDQTCRPMSDGGVVATTCTPTANTICTVVGTGMAGFGDEGVSGLRTTMYSPMDLTLGSDQNLYYVDWNNHRIRVYTTSGTVRTVAGSGELSDGDATPDSMPMRMPEPALMHRLNHPTSVTFDPMGRLVLAAWHNSMVKRVDLRTMIIEPICGTGARNFGGDGMRAYDAVFDLPVAVAFSPQGELYITDQANQRIRRVDAMGIVNTVVGTGMRGYAGDNGPAAMAQLNMPIGQAASPAGRIDFDATGNLYFADTGNHRIRRVDRMGVITTVAGNGTPGSMGDGGPATDAQLNGPADVDIGADGTLYIADTQNSCVRAVGTDGTIRTVVGRCGTRGSAGDGMAPTMATLDRPFGIETDSFGNIWVADTYNHRIRLVCSANGGPRCGSQPGR